MIAEELGTARHSMAHLLAATVKQLFPEVKLGIGPAIDDGFYYDFLVPNGFSFTPERLDQISGEMKRLITKGEEFTRFELTVDQIRDLFKNEPFKLELLNEFEASAYEISLYRNGDFIDLCSGPHVPNSRMLKGMGWQLDRVSGAYWRGDEKNPMLQRIYGLAFPSREELKQYLALREEAIRRDHRRLGAELELFTSSELIGRGLPLLLPKGATLRRILERFIVDEEIRRGYQHVYTPPLGRRKLYEISGHWEHYKDTMYPPMDVSGEELVLRPMTCPHHFQLYLDRLRSYRELPIRYAEISPQFRKEKSGELSGLVRIMMFTLADAHIICTRDQLEDEFRKVLELISFAMEKLGIQGKISFRASLRDDNQEKYVDNPEMWQKGESVLLNILDEMRIEYTKGLGDAAFYGPKLDVQMRNVLGREETLFTVQIDFCLAERFNMTYIDEQGMKQSPVIIHRSSIGSLERTMAYLIEFYGGSFPLWLAPVQARILTIADRHIPYANEVEALLCAHNIRVEKDLRNETVGKKIRESRLQKIPYLIIIGDQEVKDRSVSVRNRNTGQQASLPLEVFLANMEQEHNSYSLELHAEEMTS